MGFIRWPFQSIKNLLDLWVINIHFNFLEWVYRIQTASKIIFRKENKNCRLIIKIISRSWKYFLWKLSKKRFESILVIVFIFCSRFSQSSKHLSRKKFDKAISWVKSKPAFNKITGLSWLWQGASSHKFRVYKLEAYKNVSSRRILFVS